VGVHGPHADVEPAGDLLVAEALAEGLQHLALPGGQPGAGEPRLAIALSLARQEPQGLYDLLLRE
jgi:hypothetical protein